jgi:tetratricopeptide (TPR) repeat protein
MIALENMWVASSPDEGIRRVEHLLDRAGSVDPALRAGALRVEGGSADLAGRRDLAEHVWRESLELYRSIDDDFGIAAVESRLAVMAWRRGDWDEFRALTEDSLARSRGRFEMVEIPGHWALGQLQLHDGDLAGAIELTSRSAAMAREIGWTWWESGQLHELLMLALRSRELDEAERQGRAALTIEREHENRLWTVYTLAGLAQVALARGDVKRAGLLWGAAEREGMHFPSWEGERSRRGGDLVEREPELATTYTTGRQLHLWDAVAVALGEDDVNQTVP